MATIPDRQVLKIEQVIEGVMIPQRMSNHLGPSAIGGSCQRKTWYNFRNYKARQIDARTNRIFRRGDREEPIVIKDLKKVGVKVLTTQEQITFLSGHGNAYSDGRITNLPDAPKTEHLLEIKTANDRNFNAFVKQGVKQKSPQYWVQVQVYMKLFGLKRCLFVVANKNTDARYYERIRYNKRDATQFINQGMSILNAITPPRKEVSYQCKWCDYEAICKGVEKPYHGCRSCISITPNNDGKWHCSSKGKNISRKKQLKGCKEYRVIK